MTVWEAIRQEARTLTLREPLMGPVYEAAILRHSSFSVALAALLVHRLLIPQTARSQFLPVFQATLSTEGNRQALEEDLKAFLTRDPASSYAYRVFLFYKGFQALCVYRTAHQLYRGGQKEAAFYLQSLMTNALSIDIHPAAQLGHSLFLDHADGLVIGETAVVENKVSIMQDVTLGGTGKDTGDRHPKIAEGVLLGAGAKILGNVTIGRCAKIGACSVVLQDIPAYATAVGIPAEVVRREVNCFPALEMNHALEAPGVKIPKSPKPSRGTRAQTKPKGSAQAQQATSPQQNKSFLG